MILFEGELITEKDGAINKVGHGEWPPLLCTVNKIIITIIIIIIIIIIIVMVILIVLLNNFIFLCYCTKFSKH